MLRSMFTSSQKRATFFIAVFLFMLALLGVTLAILVDKPDDLTLKNLSIPEGDNTSNSGRMVILYPWDPTSPEKILPRNYRVPAVPGNTVSIRTCPDQFEAASFVISSQKDLSDIRIMVPDLYNSRGDRIPAGAIDVRTVKVWYQVSLDDISYTTPGSYLAPELLLKDDSLVSVDYANRINYLKVTIDGKEQYIDISSPNAVFPPGAQIHDTPALQPFSLESNENKQIWLTTHVPNTTPAGDYSGNITITSPSETPVILNFTVTVLPFELELPPVEYGLYYRGMVPANAKAEAQVGINSLWKTPAQYTLELQDMKDHGVMYPTIEQWDYNISTLNLALSLRNKTGLPTDHIYIVSLESGNSTDSEALSTLKEKILLWKNVSSQYGYRDVYIYGIDEADSNTLRSEEMAWQTAHAAGAKVFVAVSGNTDAVKVVGNTLDVVVFAYHLDTNQVAQWHWYGKRIFSYANPQVGVENPDIYRKNYGFALWSAEYDGAMDFAYQQVYGKNIWNDFDTPFNKNWTARDHVFAYPTSNGVIDTVQWEGFREGVDDTRYIATLLKNGGYPSSVRSMVSASLSKQVAPSHIRDDVIDQILLSFPNPPEHLLFPNRCRAWGISNLENTLNLSGC